MTHRSDQRPSRRDLLRTLGAAPLAASALQAAPTARAQTSSSQARIVIAGSGLGGIAVASRLRQLVPGAKITIVDAKQEHNYQPGYTLVATGIWPIEKVKNRNAEFQPEGVEWVQEMVASFDPASNSLTTTGGRKIGYDFLVVATGLQLGYDQIEGMDVKAIGSNGLGSVYASPEAALTDDTAPAAPGGADDPAMDDGFPTAPVPVPTPASASAPAPAPAPAPATAPLPPTT